MRLTIISAWFNEELLAPYFLSHYLDQADEIHILLDVDTTDATAQILRRHEKVIIHEIRYPNGFDDVIKIAAINNLYQSISDGWVLCVDSDEFVFSLDGISIKEFLLQLPDNCNVVKSDMWHPFRNRMDEDLSPTFAPVIFQRRFGSVENEHGDAYNKPCLLLSQQDMEWSVGHHLIHGNYLPAELSLQGVHWQYADPSIVLARHTRNRKDRLSPENIANGMSLHFLNYTEENVLRICNEHLDDPRLF